ncbi:MAG: AmmeMemoRadiSam system radical SAM enzyme [Candidatus Micrarchaeota archaeon]
MHDAMLWKKTKGKDVLCYLCYRLCNIKPGEFGFCRVRKNIDGKLYSLNYGKAIAANVDPIEKKPFYHFMPGTHVFSMATVGCNFNCRYCQNSFISREFREITGEDLPPKKIREICAAENVPGCSYTYTEPTIFMEYALDTAKLLRKDGRFNIFVTNGYMTTAAINEMDKYIDASRIDLKGFDDRIYKDVSGDVKLEYVLNNIKELYKRQHIEIITLLVPGYNTEDDDIRQIAKWIYDLSPAIPLHFIGFYPSYKMMDTPATQLETLKRARKIALDTGLHYVYTGNRQDSETESTYCPHCNTMVVKRFGFEVLENKLMPGGRCPECSKQLNFVTDIQNYWKRKKNKD